MKGMLASGRGKGIVPGRPQDWPAGFLRQCDNCGLEWEAFQEHENCPLADLEVELFACFGDEMLENLNPETHPVTIY